MGVLCGVDIIEIDRIKKSLETTGEAFISRVFTANEINYCEQKKAVKYQSYAARFAAKEAISKALGTGIASGVRWVDMEILNDGNGKPFVRLSGETREIFDRLNAIDISVSLSHCGDYAVAYAVIQTD